MDKPLLFIESFLDTVKRFDAYDLSIILIFGISLILTSAIAIIQKPPKKEFFIASSVIIFLTIYSIIENIKIVIANADETVVMVIPYRIQRGLFEASGYFLIPAVHDQIILLTLIPSLIIIYKTMRFLAVEYKALQLNIPYTASIKPKTRPQIGTNQQQEQSNQDKETLQDPESKKYGKII